MSHNVSLPGGRLARRSSFHVAAALALASSLPLGAAVIDFGDVNFVTPPATTYAGPGGGVYRNNASFSSGGASFNNSYDSDYGSWSGFAYSTTSDTTTVGYGNQYSAYAPSNSGTYAVAYYSAYGPATVINFDSAVAPQSVLLTNTTYTALDMLNGTPFVSKKFGGDTGNDADFLKVVIVGRDAANAVTDEIEFFLADYSFTDNSQDYIVDEWTQVDLSTLGVDVRSIEFYFESSDTGNWGINTPTYVAIDNLAFSAVPEPSSAAVLVGVAALAATAGRRRRARAI